NELIAARQRLEHAQRMEALGRLSGGIAHDFNNLLTGMLGNASLARTLLEPETAAETAGKNVGDQDEVAAKVAERLDQIEKAGRRAADLTRQMLAYSGKGGFVRRPVELPRLVRSNQALLRSTVPETIRIEISSERVPARVEADPAQLGQLLVQLVTNAAEAIGERVGRAGSHDGVARQRHGERERAGAEAIAGRDSDRRTVAAIRPPGESSSRKGTIAIRTGSRHCDRGELEQIYLGEPLESGTYAFLEVEDDGAGMGPEVRARIFEPFYSTKFTGRGLGLAAALGIVRGHGGAITVESARGQGSRFRVYLPAVDRRDDSEPATRRPSRWKDPGPVLVVDDEALVRGVVVATLVGAGYRVVEASDGEEAMELFRQNPEIRVVILDATMPRLDGAETYERLRRLRPEVRVVITSGYDQEQTIARLPGAQLAGFLRKPHRERALLDAVASAAAEALGAHRPPPDTSPPEVRIL
ncbi:MAG: response regulator, partial [Holophagales bacterium]|nr:response regulator [Holophagales bacterium]